MTKSISETLYAAADLLEGEGRWTQGELYRKSDGIKAYDAKDAACYCMAGALIATDMAWSMAWNYLDTVLPDYPGENNTAVFNDHPNRTQSEVVAKLREAGDRAREEGK